MSERDTPPEGGRKSPEDLRRYHELMRERDLLELEVREGDFYLKLSRGGSHAPVQHATHPPEEPRAAEPQKPPEAAEHRVVSPLAGVFYRAVSPSTPPFVKEGDKVAFGDVLCIVEAMKVMNEIRADRPGTVAKVLVENGKPVTAGQDLFQIAPAA